jgi:hypothetical protein
VDKSIGGYSFFTVIELDKYTDRSALVIQGPSIGLNDKKRRSLVMG